MQHGELGRDAGGHAAKVVVHVEAGGGFDFDAALAYARRLHEADFALAALRDLHAGAEDEVELAAVGRHAHGREHAEAGGVHPEVALGLNLVLRGLADFRHAAGLEERARGALAG